MPKLQIALDTVAFEEAFTLVKQLDSLADIVEVGTPFLIKYGLKAVYELKHTFPFLEILCDGKIMDAGAYESGSMFAAGADWITVMGVTDNATIQECVSEAVKANGKVMVDMLCVFDVAEKVSFLEGIGVDCVAAHTGIDQQRQKRTALDDLRELKRCVVKSKVAVAGGITVETADAYLKLKPDILIVGNGILAHSNPVDAARAIRDKILSYAAFS